MGNNWEGIGRLMGKSGTWVRNAWEQVLERENIPEDMNLQFSISNFIENIKEKIIRSTQIIQDESEETKRINACVKAREGKCETINEVANEKEITNIAGDISERKKNQIIRTTLSNMKTNSKGNIL